MKPFRFRLGRVLRVRQLLEEVARGELAGARADERRAEEGLQTATEGVLDALRSERAFRSTGPFAPEAALSLERQTERLRAALPLHRVRVDRAARAAATVEARWRDRRSDVEALERMRARARERWVRERFAREQSEADEATLARVAARNLKDSAGPVDLGIAGVSNAEEPR